MAKRKTDFLLRNPDVPFLSFYNWIKYIIKQREEEEEIFEK